MSLTGLLSVCKNQYVKIDYDKYRQCCIKKFKKLRKLHVFVNVEEFMSTKPSINGQLPHNMSVNSNKNIETSDNVIQSDNEKQAFGLGLSFIPTPATCD
ncbi:hypothetical protein GJ496_010720 [Pomphorhynchus laevis]|nr:hypothetical protein GJ496_010720 [Pomphorhynchus laevis]